MTWPESVPAVFTFDVGSTDRRPVVPDQYVSRVRVSAHTEVEATELAALMVMRGQLLIEEDWVPNRPNRCGLWLEAVQMPTSTTLVDVEW